MTFTPSLRTSLACAALLGLAVSACVDDGLQPSSGVVPYPPRERGINVYLSVDDPNASVGELVQLDARLAIRQTNATISGFVAALAYDTARVEVVDQVAINDGGTRVSNLAAGDGLARFAGASSRGLASGILFSVHIRPRTTDYLDGLALTVDELNTLEDGFAERSRVAHVSKLIHLSPR